MFYDPAVQTAGEIAEEYQLSVSDVLGLLLQAGKDETLVREVLAASVNSITAKETQRLGRPFDMVAYARPLLVEVMKERSQDKEP